MTYADIFCPNRKQLVLLYNIGLVYGCSWLIALSARISIPLPWTPVPITGQTFAVLFLSACMGGWRAVCTVLFYLLQGILGLPVFAKGGGPLYPMGPTGGYLIGFIGSAFVVGKLAELGFTKTFLKTFVVMLIGNLVIYVFGLLWLSRFVPEHMLLKVGLLPFIPGDLFKIFVATLWLPFGWKLLQMNPHREGRSP